jgi:RNA polymerase sigma-70 factor (ECF subfamily)
MNMQKSDTVLIEEYKNGSQDAFAELFYRYKNGIYNFIYRLVGNPDVADDLLQNTFIKMIKSIDKYQERNRFKQWLFSIANSVTIDYLRKRKREYMVDPIEDWMEITDNSISLQATLEQEELMNCIEEKIERLPPKQKRVFLMRQESDLTFREIAEILQCPVSTVLSRIHNAVVSLRKSLKECENEM